MREAEPSIQIEIVASDADQNLLRRARLIPDAPAFVTKGAQTTLQVAGTYFWLGVDHILSGLDHLPFVLALILLIRDRWMLVKTITAFTVAHSLTLAAASLGYVSLPPAPVEAVIALSDERQPPWPVGLNGRRACTSGVQPHRPD